MARRRVSKSQIIWFAHVLRDARPRPQHRDQTFGFLQVPRFFPVLDKHKPQEIAAWRKPSDGSVIMRASPWPYRTVCEHPHRCASSRMSARPAALPGSVTPGSCLEISACLGDGRRSFTECSTSRLHSSIPKTLTAKGPVSYQIANASCTPACPRLCEPPKAQQRRGAGACPWRSGCGVRCASTTEVATPRPAAAQAPAPCRSHLLRVLNNPRCSTAKQPSPVSP